MNRTGDPERVKNMALGIMIGDSYGSAYEFRFADRNELEKNLDFTRYDANPREDFNPFPGMYTDDTQMSIGVMEALLKEDFSREGLARQFLKVFHRNPINGYARRFQRFLEHTFHAEDFLRNMKPVSERNGAAMRAVPIGVLKDKDLVREYAEINASLTHDTPKGIASSVATALLSHHQLYNLEDDIFDYIDKHVRPIDEESADHFQAVRSMETFDSELMFGKKHKDRGIPCDGMRTVGGVLYVLKTYSNPSDVLRQAVLLGGDTDSTASISLGIKMTRHGLEELPEFLYKDLKDHKYGKTFMAELGEKLGKKFYDL